jgi:nickel/cobalt transporter (NicO) family protein
MKRLVLCLLCVCAVHLPVAAHVLDQYLQVAQIALAPSGVSIELRLIPGVQVAERICILIDADGDGQITTAEEQSYARRVVQDIALEMDGRRAPLALTAVQFPSRSEMNEGIGAIRLDLAAEAALDTAGEHQLSFRNDHLPELGGYLANALVPTTDAIKITGQQRDALQHGLQVDFRVLSVDARAWPRWTGVLLFGLCLAMLLPQWKRLRRFLRRIEDDQISAKKTVS